MDETQDPRDVALEAVRLRSEQNAADVAILDAACLDAARECVGLWHRLWFEAPVSVDQVFEIKFRVCFPLAAHALNHVETALELLERRPWVAASCARAAFEHALAAQWVMLTEVGERELVNWMNGQRYLRATEFADGLARVPFDADDASLLLDPAVREALLGDPPDPSGWSVANACSRFADTKLFYDMYRNLSQAEHPSLGLIATHLAVTRDGVRNNLSAAGSLSPSDEAASALGLSALWAMHVLEQMRKDGPHAATFTLIGDRASLPVDLRASDRHPERQPACLPKD